MAATVFHAPCSAPSVKPLDRQNSAGLKSTPSLRFGCVKTTSLKASQRHARFVVKASESGHGPLKKTGRSDAECEAAVAGGNVPEAPPVPPKPAGPTGTPVVPSLVSV